MRPRDEAKNEVGNDARAEYGVRAEYEARSSEARSSNEARCNEARSVKSDSAVAYSRSATDETNPSRSGNLVGLHVPIDVNFDQADDVEPARETNEGNNQSPAGQNTAQNEKKNGMTLVVIALMTIFMFLLAGISIQYTDGTSSTSFAALVGSAKKVSADVNEPAAKVDDTLGTVSDILSSRISLISSKNPKFIVTADGKKIIPSDTIDGSLTVVDILVDHIVVTSNGTNLKIAY